MTNKKNPEYFLKYSRKKSKNFKSICAVLDYSKPKIFFLSQPWWPTFFQVLISRNYFSATTALNKRANVPYGVPMFYLVCQCAKQRANFSTWCADMTKNVRTFQTFLLRNAKRNFYILLLYKKFYIILYTIVIHIIWICIAHKNCIILHLYTSCHIKEKCLEFLFFIIFFLFVL